MKWQVRLLVFLTVALAVGYFIAPGISPYDNRPTCATAGAMSDKEVSEAVRRQQHLPKLENGQADCYYKLKITEIEITDGNGQAKGHVPISEIEWNKRQNDWLRPFRNMVRRALSVENYPLDIFTFRVTGAPNDLKGKIAYFKSTNSNSEVLTFISDICDMKEKLIKAHLEEFYEDKTIYVPDEFRQECPNLKEKYEKT